MGSLGLPELLVVLVIVIVIFGANRLPQLGQGIGSAIRNFKNSMGDPDAPASTASVGTCKSCGTSNPADSSFCRKCGAKI
jgi:sec-independent protein translocase protein TatA